MTTAPAESRCQAKVTITQCEHRLALHAVISAAPGRKQVAACAARSQQVDRIRCLHSHHAADRRAAVKCRSRTVQNFDVLNQAGIDEVTRCVGKTAYVEVVR